MYYVYDVVIHFYPWYKFHFLFILLFLEYIVTYTKTKENKTSTTK